MTKSVAAGLIRINRLVVGPIETNCYVVYRQGASSAVVVDPGDEGGRICHALENAGLKTEAILLTHGHFDHIGAVEQLHEQSKAPVYAPKAEQKLLSDPVVNLSAGHFAPIRLEEALWVSDGDSLTLCALNWQVMATPGHTCGSVCYYIPEEKVLFSGDTLFAGSVGRTDLPTGDAYALHASLNEKVLPLPDETRIFPGHGQTTNLHTEKQINPYLR